MVHVLFPQLNSCNADDCIDESDEFCINSLLRTTFSRLLLFLMYFSMKNDSTTNWLVSMNYVAWVSCILDRIKARRRVKVNKWFNGPASWDWGVFAVVELLCMEPREYHTVLAWWWLIRSMLDVNQASTPCVSACCMWACLCVFRSVLLWLTWNDTSPGAASEIENTSVCPSIPIHGPRRRRLPGNKPASVPLWHLSTDISGVRGCTGGVDSSPLSSRHSDDGSASVGHQVYNGHKYHSLGRGGLSSENSRN